MGGVKIAFQRKLRVAGCVFTGYYMHDVTPKVVAMAVRTVMTMWMIFWMMSFLFMVSVFLRLVHNNGGGAVSPLAVSRGRSG